MASSASLHIECGDGAKRRFTEEGEVSKYGDGGSEGVEGVFKTTLLPFYQPPPSQPLPPLLLPWLLRLETRMKESVKRREGGSRIVG